MRSLAVPGPVRPEGTVRRVGPIGPPRAPRGSAPQGPLACFCLTCGVAAGVALAAVPTPALADEATRTPVGTVRVLPATVAPGGTVRLRVTGCRAGAARAVSTAFDADARLRPAAGGVLAGRARIRANRDGGVEPVTVDCDGTAVATSQVTVVVGRPTPQLRSVRLPVGAGADGGVAAGRPADERHHGFGGADAYGLALTAATALGFGVAAVHRRRRTRGAGGR